MAAWVVSIFNDPVVGIAVSPQGTGYWEVAGDGGIFAFGTSGFFGNPAVVPPVPTGGSLAQVVTIATNIKRDRPSPDGTGGRFPYPWGGGHGTNAGPSYGTCAGYTGSSHAPRPAPLESTALASRDGCMR